MEQTTMRQVQWFQNGDHPHDEVGQPADDGLGGTYTRLEGKVVRFFRHPEFNGKDIHDKCGYQWHFHGWIDNGGDGVTVCPGMMVPVSVVKIAQLKGDEDV